MEPPLPVYISSGSKFVLLFVTAQEHNVAEVDFEPTTSCSGVQESANRPPCSPFAKYELFMISCCQDMNTYIKLYYCLNCSNFGALAPPRARTLMWHLQKQNFHAQLFFRNAEFGIWISEFGIENSYRSKKVNHLGHRSFILNHFNKRYVQNIYVPLKQNNIS